VATDPASEPLRDAANLFVCSRCSGRMTCRLLLARSVVVNNRISGTAELAGGDTAFRSEDLPLFRCVPQRQTGGSVVSECRRLPFFVHSLGGATVAPILVTANGVSAVAQGNHRAAVSTLGGFECGRIGQNLEIVFVGPVIHVRRKTGRIRPRRRKSSFHSTPPWSGSSSLRTGRTAQRASRRASLLSAAWTFITRRSASWRPPIEEEGIPERSASQATFAPSPPTPLPPGERGEG